MRKKTLLCLCGVQFQEKTFFASFPNHPIHEKKDTLFASFSNYPFKEKRTLDIHFNSSLQKKHTLGIHFNSSLQKNTTFGTSFKSSLQEKKTPLWHLFQIIAKSKPILFSAVCFFGEIPCRCRIWSAVNSRIGFVDCFIFPSATWRA